MQIITPSTTRFSPIEQDITLPKAIICDLDGTLCKNVSGRSPYDWSRVGEDDLNSHIAEILFRYKNTHNILLVSGRDGVCEPETREWLSRYNIYYDALWMRTPDDMRKDDIVKFELYQRHILPNYYVELVLDDRNQVVKMWRALNLNCLQVNYGDF